MKNKIRTRIAPSPTGSPHIGTIYQALFDYAFAKKNKGQFIVRIEDTDLNRLVAGAEEKIYQALDWFGLTEDESPRKGGKFAPYKQSERREIYQKYASKLIEKGHAYYCFCTKERLERLRQSLQKENKPIIYDKHCFNLSKEVIEKNLFGKNPYVIRLKVPKDTKIVVKDGIRGEITFGSNIIDDQVLIKSDGYPTYHLAAIVDDHLMEITHVVRGEEWISSFPKHILLYDFFGWGKPLFFHTPDLRNPDHSKLSKRHGHTDVFWYKENGFLPEAILNFLALLGWSHPEGKEIFSKEEFIKLFDLKNIRPVGPIFDIKKLEWMNGVYIRQARLDELKSKIIRRLADQKSKIKDIDDDLLTKLVSLAQTRMITLNDFERLTKFIFEDAMIELSDKEKKVAENLIQQFTGIKEWKLEMIFTSIKYIMAQENIKMPLIYKIITGNESGLPLPQVLEILGKEETLERIKKVTA